MELAIQGMLIGIVATISMYIWAVFAKYVFHLPTTDWAMVGRGIGHLPGEKFVHYSISDAAPILNERVIGWLSHYITGLVYGLAYLYIVEVLLFSSFSLLSALVRDW